MLFGNEHVKRYEETDGAEGHEWQGTTALILATTGRKSGQQRKSPLIYQKYGDDYLVVASKGGADEPPAWYLNLEANPEVQVQVLGDKFTAHARTANEPMARAIHGPSAASATVTASRRGRWAMV